MPNPPQPQTPRGCKKIRVVVSPAGSGKSYFLRQYEYATVIEADDICLAKNHPDLVIWKSEAYRTKSWEKYDSEYAACLKKELPEGYILLCASSDLAHALEAEVLAVITVTKDIWTQNMKNRGSNIPKHAPGYDKEVSDPNSIVCASNEEYAWTLASILYRAIQST